MENKNFDIIIVGLGPAGCMLAWLLKDKFKIAAIDKKGSAAGFKKPCGGLLAPDAQKEFAKFNITLPKTVLVDPQIFAVRTIDLQAKLTKCYQRFYLNMDRHKFDMWMRSLIPQSVKIFEDSCVCAINKTAQGFDVKFKTGDELQTISSKYIVGADGANSIVRKTLCPKHKIRKYTAIQQWFKELHPKPFYSCLFDAQDSDCYSWSISKDGYFIFGGAYDTANSRNAFERQKQKLKDIGFIFDNPVKTEACLVLRPAGWRQFCTGSANAFLIGEAAGFISPSSLEGISSAIISARCLSKALSTGKDPAKSYSKLVLPLRIKLYLKLLKCPFMYHPLLRKLIMLSGIKSIKILS